LAYLQQFVVIDIRTHCRVFIIILPCLCVRSHTGGSSAVCACWCVELAQWPWNTKGTVTLPDLLLSH